MKYKEVKIFMPTERLDESVELLAALGRTDIIINDPRDALQFENGKRDYTWDYADDEMLRKLSEAAWISFYIGENDDVPADVLEAFADLRIQTQIEDDGDWLHNWEKYFVPTKVTDSITVKPCGAEYQAHEGETLIEIEPGMAFGTGTHPTTSMCLELLEKYISPCDSVLDVGCGTGILSVAAAKLGAWDVLAVDLDPEAVKSSIRNAELNSCLDCIRVREGDLAKDVDYKADVVVANLMADLVIALSADVARHCSEHAFFISSGILDEKEELVSAAIRAAGFMISEVLHKDGWCAICAKHTDE